MAYIRQSSNNRRNNNNRNNNNNRSNNGGNNRRSNTGGQNSVNRVYDSNGPDGRVRGTAAQIFEKYTSMARDVSSSDDKALMHAFYQHAEHYQRILNDLLEEQEKKKQEQPVQTKDNNDSNDDNADQNTKDAQPIAKENKPAPRPRKKPELSSDDHQKADTKAKITTKDEGKMTEPPSFLAPEKKTETV